MMQFLGLQLPEGTKDCGSEAGLKTKQCFSNDILAEFREAKACASEQEPGGTGSSHLVCCRERSRLRAIVERQTAGLVPDFSRGASRDCPDRRSGDRGPCRENPRQACEGRGRSRLLGSIPHSRGDQIRPGPRERTIKSHDPRTQAISRQLVILTLVTE
jgi:hypothetical protein